MYFLQRARLQFVPAVLPRCHWHLICSSHTTITATIPRNLWIPKAGASIVDLCRNDSDDVLRHKSGNTETTIRLKFFQNRTIIVVQTKGRGRLSGSIGIHTVKLQGHVNGVNVSITFRLSSPVRTRETLWNQSRSWTGGFAPISIRCFLPESMDANASGGSQQMEGSCA